MLLTDTTCSVSPSVYVAYRDLRESDVCMSFGNGDFTRGRAYNTTIAYEPGFLSTSMCTGAPEGGYRGYASLNLTELQYPTSHNGTCQGLDIQMENTTNGPYLSMPPGLNSLDPAWSTCDVVYWGAFDPPIALHTATALVQDPGQNSPPTPAPGSPVTPPHSPATSTVPPGGHRKPATNSAAPNVDPKAKGAEQQTPHPSDPIKSSVNDPKPDPQDPDSQGSKPQYAHSQDPNSQDPKAQDPDSQDPNLQDPDSQDPNSQDPKSNDPKTQDPPPQVHGEDDTDPPDPVNSPTDSNNGHPVPSAATPAPHNDGNVEQGNSGKPADPQTNNNQAASETSEGDSGAGLGNEYNAGPSSDSAGTLDQNPTDHAQALPSIGGHQIQAASGGGIIIGSTTIPPGAQTTIDSTPLSVDKDQLIIASSTIPLNPIITLVNGDVISAGGKAAIVSGTTVALAPNDDALIVNGKTSPLPPPPSSPSIPLLTVAGETLTPAPTGFVIEGQSVLPGGSAVTFAGSTFSLASASNALDVNEKIIPLPSTPTSVFKAGSQTFTAAATGFEIGTQSVSPGGSAAIVDGTVVSLGPSQLVVGTSTMLLGPGSAEQGDGGALGSLIMGGIGGGASSTTGGLANNGSDVVPFVGDGGRVRAGLGTVLCALVVSIGVVVVLHTPLIQPPPPPKSLVGI